LNTKDTSLQKDTTKKPCLPSCSIIASFYKKILIVTIEMTTFGISGKLLLALTTCLVLTVVPIAAFLPATMTTTTMITRSQGFQSSTSRYLFDFLKPQNDPETPKPDEEEEKGGGEATTTTSDDPIEKIFGFFFGAKEDEPMGMKRFGMGEYVPYGAVGKGVMKPNGMNLSGDFGCRFDASGTICSSQFSGSLLFWTRWGPMTSVCQHIQSELMLCVAPSFTFF
jgi:hypothetical protein